MAAAPTTTRGVRPLLRTVITVLALVLGTLLVPTAAHADGETGTISGVVTGEENVGQVGIRVEAWSAEGDNWGLETSTVTTAADGDSGTEDGHYSLELPAGTYHLVFVDPNGGLTPLYYRANRRGSSPSDADDIVVTAGGTRTVDARMTAPGQISGTITGSTGNNLEGIEVTPYRLNPATGDWESQKEADPEQVTHSDALGNYFLDLSTGIYRLEFSDPSNDWKTAYYGPGGTTVDSISQAQSFDIVAPSKDTVGIDVVLRYPRIVATTSQPKLVVSDPWDNPRALNAVRVEDQIEVVNGAWSADGESVTVTYQWQRNGADIPAGRYSSYEPTSADVGKTISVKIIAAAPRHEERTTTLSLTAAVRVSDRCEYLTVRQQGLATARTNLTKAQQLVTDIQLAPSRLKTLTKQVPATAKALKKANTKAKKAKKKLAAAKKKVKKAKKPAQLAKAKRALAKAQQVATNANNAARNAKKAAANAKAALAAHKRAMASYPTLKTAQARVVTAQQGVTAANNTVTAAITLVGANACA